jgi:hypothetical protein
MALQFREVSVEFDPTSGSTQHQTVTAVFDGQVQRATVALKGFNIRYNNGDHNLLEELVDPFVIGTNNNTVTAQVDFLLRDSSGNVDDPFSGSVALLVLADVA